MPDRFRPTAERPSYVRRFIAALLTLSMGVAGFAASAPAHAEGQIRIAEQFGIVYLLSAPAACCSCWCMRCCGRLL
jgi:NitT/TauT family transport system substrate-binding protein